MHTVRNIIITFALLYLWCLIWSGLEILIYGYTENRAVDNIIYRSHKMVWAMTVVSPQWYSLKERRKR